MHWCQQELYQLGVTTPPIAGDFLSRRLGTTPDWYVPFLYRTRAHVAAKSQPLLQLAPSPSEEETGELTAAMPAPAPHWSPHCVGPDVRIANRIIGTFYLLAQKVVFCNSDLDKSTTAPPFVR
jgi:hypothetical protein